MAPKNDQIRAVFSGLLDQLLVVASIGNRLRDLSYAVRPRPQDVLLQRLAGVAIVLRGELLREGVARHVEERKRTATRFRVSPPRERASAALREIDADQNAARGLAHRVSPICIGNLQGSDRKHC